MKVIPFPCGPSANESERKAFEHICSRIASTPGDDEWILLTNLAFSVTHQLQSDEIDIVAIGPPGVRVIEVKHWTQQWVEDNESLVEQEAERATNKARKIGTTLRKAVREIGRVDAVILLTREPSRVKRLAGRPIRGVNVYPLKEWREAVGIQLGADRVLSPQQVRRLGRILEPRSGVAIDGSLRWFAGYVNLERRTPKDERFHRIYAGVHSARQDRVILHLYDLSASDAGNAEAKARREFDVLRQLQQYDWAPRILDSFQDAPGYAGDMYFFTVVDPAAPSVAERLADGSWDTPARLAFARSAIRALRELHEISVEDEPIVHRNVTARTLLVRHDNTPIVTGFAHAKIPSDVSVASSGAPSGGWEPETAPEVRKGGLHAAGRAADVYAICTCLTTLFRDQGSELTRQVVETLAAGLADDPEERGSLEDLEATLAGLLGESPPTPPPPPARFWTEDQIVPFQGRDYRVVSRLGSGGVGTTFKVVEIDRSTGHDLGTYVAKVAHDREVGRRIVSAYSLARSHLGRHPSLSAIFQVAPEWHENEFTALMTWVEGSPVRDFMGVLPLLAEEQGDDSGSALVLRWFRVICEALDVLHRNGLVHGDVSPANLILSEHDVVLTDYDFVSKIGQWRVAPGTVLYSAPGFVDHPATPSDDIYALAASVFHVLFEREPFRYNDALAKERGLNWKGVDRAEYPAVVDILQRATHPDPSERFQSVNEALEALRTPIRSDRRLSDVGGTRSPTTTVAVSTGSIPGNANARREERVPYLRSLLQSYPGSRWGNRETRGLDTPFAEQTYVETSIEETLYRDLLDRRVRLVVLCGNAGDGKTALLQQLARRLGIGKCMSSQRILKGTTDDGLSVQMNLDGSAAWQDKSADELLDEFLAPFQYGPPDGDIAHLLAINDGRLLEWIEQRETPLAVELLACLDDAPAEEASDSHIRFISLNQRSLVGGITPDGAGIETTFLERLVDGLYGGDRAPTIWAPCQTCSAQERCEVLKATRMFAPDDVPGEPMPVRRRARERLFEALQAVHLRGETHITVRELRATLVYILFGIHDCSDYHAVGESAALPLPQPYSDRAFAPASPGRQGEVLRELVRFDPALEAHPRIDRYLLGSPPGAAARDTPRHHGLPLASARRRAYFEWTADDIKLLTGDSGALDLAKGQHLREFRNLSIVNDAGSREELTRRLCRGISRLQSLPPQALDRPGAVPLHVPPRTPTETEFWVEKRMADFRLEAEVPPAGRGLDRLHRQVFLIYSYRDGDGAEERLRLGAELFHLLLELSDGYQLGDDSTDDTFTQLSIFVQRLVREDHRQLYAWNPMRESTIHEVSAALKDPGSETRQTLVLRDRSDAK